MRAHFPILLCVLLSARCAEEGGGGSDGAGGEAGGMDGGAAAGAAACVATRTAPAAGGRTYYVSPTGSDGSSGASAAAALRTIAAALGRAAPGDVIEFEAGATFNEVVDLQRGKGGADGRSLVLSSDPVRRARIVAPAGKVAVNLQNVGHVTVENLVIAGPGMNSTRSPGVRALSEGGRFAGLAFRNLEVSGFNEGLSILSYLQAADGFDDVLIEQVDLHDNLQGGGSTYGLGVGSMTNVVVRCSRFHHNPGAPAVKRPSGDGFVLGGVRGGLIDGCVAHDNGGQGTNNAGPVGLWGSRSSSASPIAIGRSAWTATASTSTSA